MSSTPVPSTRAVLDRAVAADGLRNALAATRHLAPATAAAITHHGEILAVDVQGTPRRDGSPTARGTVFRIASMTKSFLAATALALRDDGLLDLHAPAAEYVPGLAAATFQGRPVSMTLSSLLSNRAGLTEDNAWVDEMLGEPRELIGELVDSGLRLAALPDSEYHYSNLGISMIGRAIESVTGLPVEVVMQERIIDPLGLSDTRAAASLYPRGTDLALGFRTFDDGMTFVEEPFVGSGALACIGSLFSTLDDIARWMHFLSTAFDADPVAEDVLCAASRRELQGARSMIPISGARFDRHDVDGAGYGYGVVVEHDRRFGRILQHAGGLPGFSSHMRWHPASGLGAVVFGNSDAFDAGPVAAQALRDTLTTIGAPAAIVRPWSDTLAAASVLDDLVRTGRPLSDATDLLARNVLRDVPVPVRDTRLRAAFDEVGDPLRHAGPVSQRIVTARDAASLRWRIPCERGALICDVHLMGLPDPLVQSFSIRVGDGDIPRGEVSDVTAHYAVELP
ncbi:serine hydrolase domain-containing protein [Microbacterium murale]|uniref:CubicO group peptidase (Beta-lactamase class C family) n=1 Tax=Microbacterium murale TaxID=1081040 RepID=A0ABU0PB41_9MICO|nr:serine hydrolase domain-containing protein [Microbacterium murale]MDQ0644122.1 CubicO group peptidase (beta-lactamase class C family) [Microbacterium murale]